MIPGLYTYDPEVVESRWRLHRASDRYLWRRHARLYLTAPYCAAWLACGACGPVVRALRAG